MNKFQKLMTLSIAAVAAQVVLVSPVSAEDDLMMVLDADKDGFISLKEAVGDAELLKNFGTIDTDEDGKISKEELLAAKLNIDENALTGE